MRFSNLDSLRRHLAAYNERLESLQEAPQETLFLFI
jgi:hypothetical protein